MVYRIKKDYWNKLSKENYYLRDIIFHNIKDMDILEEQYRDKKFFDRYYIFSPLTSLIMDKVKYQIISVSPKDRRAKHVTFLPDEYFENALFSMIEDCLEEESV
jgi:hypothetical protein